MRRVGVGDRPSCCPSSPLARFSTAGLTVSDNLLTKATRALSEGWGEAEMRHTLLTVAGDHLIEPRESRSLSAAVAPVPARTELCEAMLPPEELPRP